MSDGRWTETELVTQTGGDSFAARWRDVSTRAALWLFLCYLLGAAVYLVIAGREAWFIVDDWDFLTRSATNLQDLLRDRNQHWAAVWLVAYQVLFHFFGVSSHLPYTVAAASVHLTVAFLLRVVMRRAGVGPWTATVVASSYVLLGPAARMMVAGFHPSLALGLGQLILADHDEGIRRRDWGALLCGALSIMGHNMGVVLVGIVGVAVLLRRGWRTAAFHVLPLATMYFAWWLWDRPPSGGYFPGMFRMFVDWMRFGISGAFTAVGHYSILAAALATVLVVGLLVAWVPDAGRRLRGDGAAPAALLFGVPVLLAAIFPIRAFLGVHGGADGRFLWVTVALTLPAMAVATDALVRRRRTLAPVLLLFVAGIPANFGILKAGLVLDRFDTFNRALFLALSSSPLLDTTPGWVLPAPSSIVLGYEGLTVAWLRQARADNRLPPANSELLTPEWQVQATARLSVVSAPGGAVSRGVCRDEVLPLKLTPAVGDRIGITSRVVLTVDVGGHGAAVLSFDPRRGKTIQIIHPVTSVVVEADSSPAAFAPIAPSTSPPRVVSVALCSERHHTESIGGMGGRLDEMHPGPSAAAPARTGADHAPAGDGATVHVQPELHHGRARAPRRERT